MTRVFRPPYAETVDAAATGTDEPGWVPLIDVSGIPIRELIGQADTVVARALQQVLESLDGDGAISAFQSFAAPGGTVGQ